MSAEEIRMRTEAELERILPRRRPDAAVTILGAGNDDLGPGRAYLAKLAPGGYMVPTWPVEHGGMGLAGEEAAAVRQALSGFEAPDLYPWMVGIDLIGPTILAHGDEEQKRRWLPGIRTGEEIWCQMFSEPDAGSDLAGLKSRATRDGEGWRVSGAKVWTSRAHYSRWGLLLARHDFSLPKHRGITAFGLDMSSPGVTVRPLVQMNRDAHFNEVFMDDVWIPDSDRIGGVGEGWRVALTCLGFERGALGGGLGVTADQVDRLAKMLPPGDAVARDRWAARYADFQAIRYTELRTKAAAEAGREAGPEGSGSKLRGTAMVKRLAELAVAAEGAAATVEADQPDEWVSMFLMSPSLSIRGGTDEIQRNILGERVLGLPPEPRVDKDKPFSETV
ncbi:MAG TPA: acyl-CoA dehydrogenase family protein [Acidimicrobiales bacterium]|nr:acyl-CoA dehydrogenase family protein [Acidimicrobiales bacterium]